MSRQFKTKTHKNKAALATSCPAPGHGNLGATNAPNILGLSEVDATLKAADFMLNVGVIVYDNTVQTYMDSINATVIKQDPVKNVPLRPGDEIDIWLSLKSEYS